jgi:hypothetical protein
MKMNVKLYKATDSAGLVWHVGTYPQAATPDIVPTLVRELVDTDIIIDLDLEPPALGMDNDRIRVDLFVNHAIGD